MSVARSAVAAGSVVVAAGLLAGPASAAHRPHIPRPPAPPSARSAPPGVRAHPRVMRLERTRRHARRHGARAASLPPVTSIPTWSTAYAECDNYFVNSYTHAYTDVVKPPDLTEGPSAPGRAYLRFYWRAGVTLWDPVNDRWVTGPSTDWQISSPIDEFAYELGFYIPSGAIPMRVGTRMYGYTWIEAWWHYTATADESWSGTGGIWYSGSHYADQWAYGPLTRGACWWG